MIRRVLVASTLVLSVATAAALAQSNAAAPHLVIVNMVNVSPTRFAFEPAQLTVHPGDTVRFVQTGAMPHNVQFTHSPAGSNLGAAAMGPFLTAAGQKYDLVIDGRFALGQHDFVCTPHASMGMTGALTVQGPVVGTR